jgi:GT2 family glycosyltransferase
VTAPDLSVICVTYQSRGHVVDCLRSAQASAGAAGVSTELIVVDNASTDGSADVAHEAIPEATIMRNGKNIGFGAANNRAFTVAQGSAWLLLNPDARLDEDALAPLLAAQSADPRLAAAGPSIRGAGMGGAESAGMLPGIRSMAGHFLFLNRLLPADRGGPWRGWMLRPRRGRGNRPVEWASGAALLLRPEAVREVGGFDEAFFLYGEDTDLCARLLDHAWRVALVPAATAWHAIGASQAPGSTRWIDGLDAFMRRRGRGRLARAACFVCMALGLAIRGLPWPAGDGERRASDARRMRLAAGRALAMAFGR